MEKFYSQWRRRFAVHAALILAMAGVVGFQYRNTLQFDEPTCAPHEEARICDPTKTDEEWEELLGCKDNPCLPDTVYEHRWRSAHTQGLQHALLLLGFAIAAPYFRIGRFLFGFAGWLVIVGCWAAPLSAVIQAAVTYLENNNPKVSCLVISGTEVPAWDCMATTIGAVAGISTGIAILLVAIRSFWEALRDAIAPATWRNWARIVKARPRRVEEPMPDTEVAVTDVRRFTELIRVVQEAMNMRMCVRAFGGRYSWSGIAPTRDTMIDMRKFRAIQLPVDPDPSDQVKSPDTVKTVTVETGAMMREVTEALAAHNVMLATSTVIPWVQVGGVVALGCHGTGVKHPPLVDLIAAMDIIQYDMGAGGPVATLKSYRRPLVPESVDPTGWKEWRALMVNLGCLGVMVRITLECVPIHNVHILDTRKNMQATIDSDGELRAIVANDYPEIFWFPFNDELFIRAWNKIEEDPVPGFGLWFWIRQWLVAKVIGPPVFWLIAFLPFITRVLSRQFHRMVGTLDHRVAAPEAMQYERFFMRVYDMGYAIPFDPTAPGGFELFRKAWYTVVDGLNAWHRQAIYPQNLTLHVRFGRRSVAHLAPNSGTSGHFAYIEIVTHANTARHQEYFEAVERDWRRFGGKPHWGKVTYDLERVTENYGQTELDDFLEQRRLMDPEQVFLNEYVREALHEEAP